MSISTASEFKSSPIPWEGFGINIKVDDGSTMTNQLQGLNSQWTRIFLEISDPGADGIYYDNAAFDRLWERSQNIQTQITRFAYATFELMQSKFIFTARSAPVSWLTTDGTNELRGDALVAFARLFVSGILVHRKFGMPVHWVEILDEPSTVDGTFINPDNYVILVSTFKSILAERLAPSSVDIHVMGPGLSCIVTKAQSIEPYIDAFKNTTVTTPAGSIPLLDAWSIHVVENPIDAPFFNAGTFDARCYVANQLKKTVRLMGYTIPGIPVYVTKFGTNATRYAQGIDYSAGAPETVEYAMRLMDNVCGILQSGASSALSWFLNYRNDKKALYRKDGTRRPQRDALALLNKIVPTNGKIFNCNDTLTGTPSDQTLKGFVSAGNSFGFILSRPQLNDAASGKLKLSVSNTEWNLSTYRCTMTLYAYPSSISLGAVKQTVSSGNGKLTIDLQNLPYNCIVYGKGDVYAYPTLLTPTIPRLPINIPRVFDVTRLVNVNTGDIVYNTSSGNLMIFVDDKWHPCQTYSGVVGTRHW